MDSLSSGIPTAFRIAHPKRCDEFKAEQDVFCDGCEGRAVLLIHAPTLSEGSFPCNYAATSKNTVEKDGVSFRRVAVTAGLHNPGGTSSK